VISYLKNWMKKNNNMDELESTTKGVGKNIGEWADYSTDNNSTTGIDEADSKNSSSSTYGDILKQAPKFLKDLESNLPFTVMIISIIGYIVIASFGQMDSVRKYIGYLLFLFLMFCGYKVLRGDFLKAITKKTNKILWFLILVLIIFIFFQNFNSIIYFFNKVKL